MKHLCKFSANAYTLLALMLLIQVYPTSNLYSQVKIADDEASSYSGSWTNGDDQGQGFNAWSNTYGSDTGTFIGNPSSNGMGTTGIGTAAFGMYSTGGSGYVNATRIFDLGMQIGDTLTFYWAINWDANSGSKGFDLLDGASTVVNVNNGGSATITYTGGNVSTDYGTNPMTVTFSRTNSSSYSLSITERDGGGTFSASISSSAEVDRIKFYIGNQADGNGNRNMFFNHLEIKRASTGTITGDAGWRLLSLPITSGDVSDVSDDSPVQGIAGGSNTGSPSNFYIYDNSGAWEEPSNATTAWGDGYGFAMYFYHNTSNGSSTLPVTLDADGLEPLSNVTVNLYGGAANRFTLVGNPFASNINTNSITVSGGSIQNNISFWNDGGSTYSAQDRTGPYIIAPWQGFFVETSDANATSITIPTSAKTTSGTSGTFFSKVADIRGDINFALSSETTNDEAIRLSFRANATPDWDLDDASKLTPLLPVYATLGFATNDMVKSVESLPYRLEEEVTLPMQLDLVGVEGEFSLGWDGLETIPDEWELVLHDYEQGTSVNLRDIDGYTFEAEPEVSSKRNPLTVLSMSAKSMAKASQGERFGLTVRPVSVGNEEELSPYSFTLDQNYPNPFNPSTTITYSLEQSGLVSLSIYNALGQRVTQLVNKSQLPGRYNVQWDASVAPSGIYYYRLEVGDVSLTRKMTLIK